MKDKSIDNRTVESQVCHNHQSRRQGLLTVIFALSMILIVLVLTALVVSGIRHEDSLKGRWISSQGAIIEFDGFGKGSLILDDDLSKFSYETNDNTVRIDYVSDRLSDTIYEYRFTDHALVLVDGDGHETSYDPLGHSH